MAQRVIAIGGIPGTGKTTLMKRVLDDLGNRETLHTFSFKNLRGLWAKQADIYVMGIYDGTTFSGTDKLAMNVHPHFVEFLTMVNGVVLFEGNRLFNQKLFDTTPCDIYVLETTDEIREQRYRERGSNQTQRFIQSCITKTNNVKMNNVTTTLRNDDTDDLERNVTTITSLLHEQN